MLVGIGDRGDDRDYGHDSPAPRPAEGVGGGERGQDGGR